MDILELSNYWDDFKNRVNESIDCIKNNKLPTLQSNLQSPTLFLTGMVLLIIGIIGYIIGNNNPISKTPHQEYKVTISDELSYSDFTSKYEVLDQEGKIYTVIP